MSTSSEPVPSSSAEDEDRAPRISADWAAVVVAAVLVALAIVGLLPSIPFLVK